VKTKVEIRPLLTFDCEAASVDKRLVSSAAAAGVIHTGSAAVRCRAWQ